MKKRVLIFDSGLGGLSIARALRVQVPDAELVYAADNAAFPYGDWAEAELADRICEIVVAIAGRADPDAVVIACNTASTLALDHLRHRSELPFIGTVPAIKPAASVSSTGIIGVLATPGTIERGYTRALVDTFASHRDVTLHACPRLAEFAEAALRGNRVDIASVAEEIRPAFTELDGLKTDVIVLGCTHYPLIQDLIIEAAPWPVTLIDPSAAIANRAEDILNRKPPRTVARVSAPGSVLTGKDTDIMSVLKREGFGIPEVLEPFVTSG